MFTPDLLRFLRYIEFKGDCAAYQEQHPIRLDMDLAVSCRDTLEQQQREKVEQLKGVMPKVPVYVTRKPPKITHKKDGTPTKKFDEWLDLLTQRPSYARKAAIHHACIRDQSMRKTLVAIGICKVVRETTNE